MSARTYPWKYKPTPHDEQMMEEALNSQLYLVHEIGPTQFLIRGEDASAKFKVTIGDPQICSGCSKRSGASGSKSAASPDLCVHIYFVMLKVLRLPKTNNLVWQASLLDTEINSILSQRYQRMEERAARRRRQAAAGGAGAAAAAASSASAAASSTAATAASKGGKGEVGSFRVSKRELDPEDVCPICQDDLIDPASAAAMDRAPDAPPLLNLVHCQWSCGQQLHAKCMRVWAEHQLVSSGYGDKKLTCPMCRAPWTGTDPAQQQSNEDVLRELKKAEHAPVLTRAEMEARAEAKRAAAEAGSTTALVPRSHAGRSSSSSSSSGASLRCCSCRKLLPLSEGRFMRCVACTDDYNLCRVCFIRSKGIGGGAVPAALLTQRSNHVHTFVECKPCAHPAVASAEDEARAGAPAAAPEFPFAYGMEWIPAPVKAPPASSSLALSLQSRELTHADYELLLNLDENVRANGRPMLHAFLLRSLPVPAVRLGSAECVLCSRAIGVLQALRVLPCFHQVHESCLQGQLMYDVLLCCPLDSMPLFPGLAFCEAKVIPRKKKPTVESVAAAAEERAMGDAARAGAMQVQANQLMFGLSGTGLMGSSIASSPPSAAARAQLHETVEEEEDAHPAAGGGAPSASVQHSHHFQLTPSSLPAAASRAIREQRAAAAATPSGGRLRTGTAAFAAPSVGRESAPGSGHGLFTSPLQLSGSSSFAPFHMDATPSATHALASALRRGRASDDRIASSPPASSSASPIDFASLSIGSSVPGDPAPIGVRSCGSKVGRVRANGHGRSSMFAPQYGGSASASPAASPSPDSSAELGADSDSSVRQPTGSPAPKSVSRPRMGRPSLPNGLAHPAPPLSELLVGSHATPPARSASASTVRPSAAFAKSHAAAPRAVAHPALSAADAAELSLGSASGTLLTSSAAGGAIARGSSQRRGVGASSASSAAHSRSSPPAVTALASGGSSFAVGNGAAGAIPAGRPRATSASHADRSQAARPDMPSSSFARPVTLAPLATVAASPSFGLAGAPFHAMGEPAIATAPSRAGAVSGGKLRRGRAAVESR